MSNDKVQVAIHTSDKVSGVPHDCVVQSKNTTPIILNGLWKMRVVESSVIESSSPLTIYIQSTSFSQPNSYDTRSQGSSTVIGKIVPRVGITDGVTDKWVHFADAHSSHRVVVSSPQLHLPIHLKLVDGSGSPVTDVSADYSVTVEFERD